MPDRIGSFLSKADLINELNSADRQIDIYTSENGLSVKVPSDSNNRRITNVGYDVSIDCSKVFSLKNYDFIPLVAGRGGKKCVIIEPGDTFSFNTKENLQLGKNVAALIESKVRLVSKGISHISTTIDPNWQGALLLTFSNQSNNRINIYDGNPVATIVFFYLSTPVTELPEVYSERNEEMWQHYEDLSRTKKLERIVVPIVNIIMSILIFVVLGIYIIDIRSIDQITIDKIGTTGTLFTALLSFLSFKSLKPTFDWLVSLIFKSKLSSDSSL